jgi:AcrR family transcriptional regulator
MAQSFSSQPAPARAIPARDRILATAARLFYDRGMTASGVDTLSEQAKVSKRSLYRHFPSRQQLELAYLRARHQEWLDLYRRRAGVERPEQSLPDPRAGVMAVVGAYIDHAQVSSTFRGCGLLNAAAELPLEHPGRELVHRHKQQVQDILELHCSGLMGRESAHRTAEHLSFLLEGAMSRAGLAADPTVLNSLPPLARAVLDAATGRTGSTPPGPSTGTEA